MVLGVAIRSLTFIPRVVKCCNGSEIHKHIGI